MSRKQQLQEMLAVFQDRATYVARYRERWDAHRKLLETVAEKRKAFEASFSDEISESRKALSEVAPLAAEELAEVPLHRAAYSDRMSAVMAKLSMLAYIAFEDPASCETLDDALKAGGMKLVGTWCVGGTEAFLAEAPNFYALSFRGTTDGRDRRTDLSIGVAKTTVQGYAQAVQVHRGFYEAFDLVADGIRITLNASASPQKPIFITGHSLGGALALVASAALAGEKGLGGRIAAVYTFGAPRVGARDFDRVVKAPHYRLVNEGDVVPLIPPSWLFGYGHTGVLYMLAKNRVRPVRARQWFVTFFLALRGLLLWPFSKQMLYLERHAISLYCSRLDAIAHLRGRWT
jgi:pimeloyl-ACP methyl ester carboxylesterase